LEFLDAGIIAEHRLYSVINDEKGLKPKFLHTAYYSWSSLHDLLWIVAKEYRQPLVVTENVTAAVQQHRSKRSPESNSDPEEYIILPCRIYIEFSTRYSRTRQV
jgi:hypothetical protein